MSNLRPGHVLVRLSKNFWNSTLFFNISLLINKKSLRLLEENLKNWKERERERERERTTTTNTWPFIYYYFQVTTGRMIISVVLVYEKYHLCAIYYLKLHNYSNCFHYS